MDKREVDIERRLRLAAEGIYETVKELKNSADLTLDECRRIKDSVKEELKIFERMESPVWDLRKMYAYFALAAEKAVEDAYDVSVCASKFFKTPGRTLARLKAVNKARKAQHDLRKAHSYLRSEIVSLKVFKLK